MTAEIAVMNKWAVALAADSKVTIGGMGSTKTYDTVNKLFTLSKVHPVGIMVFGNAEFMEYPWETVVKLYRKAKGIQSETHIAKWGDDFAKFVSEFGDIEPKHRNRNVSGICYSWLTRIQQRAVNDAMDMDVAVGSDSYIEIIKEVLNRRLFETRQNPFWAEKANRTTISRSYAGIINDAVKVFFDPLGDKSITLLARKFLRETLVRAEFSPQSSGFVIAGFGENEYFPTVLEYNTDGWVGDWIKIVGKKPADLSRDMQSCIKAFAQGDMVARFMNGIDEELHQTLLGSFLNTLTKSCLAVLEKYGDAANKNENVRAEIESAVMASTKEVIGGSKTYIDEKFSQPVIRMVAVLPKDELAHLAESLVSLTSLKRRVSSDAETVGGPVDVALISKGDGFVWVKRKLYFPPRLNAVFAKNYMSDMDFGETEDA